VWREVELLAIQALVMARQGHFIRTFVDLGRDLTKLLSELVHQNRYAEYAWELQAEFGSHGRKPEHS
jgi:hypothetical protein